MQVGPPGLPGDSTRGPRDRSGS